MRMDFLPRPSRTSSYGFKLWEGRLRLAVRRVFEQWGWLVKHWNTERCPIPGNIQSQVGWGSDQPAPVEDVPAHGREVGLDHIEKSLLTNHSMILWFSHNRSAWTVVATLAAKCFPKVKKIKDISRNANKVLEAD